METPSTKEGIINLNMMFTVVNRFISIFDQHALVFYRIMRKEVEFE